MVPKRMEGLFRSKFLRHEAELDEGAHTVLQKTVIDLVDVRKIVKGLAIRVFIVKSDFIVENRVKTDVLESCRLPDLTQVLTVAVAKRQDGASRAKHALPIVGERPGRASCVDFDRFSPGLCKCCPGRAGKEDDNAPNR